MATRDRIIPGLAVALVLVLTGASDTLGVIIRVPIDQPTIAAGLAAANPGDIVEVYPGPYYEHDLVVPCGVTLRGVTGNPECVIIDGQQMGRVLNFTNTGEGTVVADLTITGGQADYGGGLHFTYAAALIENCIIRGNSAGGYGGGVYAIGSASIIDFVRCLFIANMAIDYDGGALFATQQATVNFLECVFRGNSAGRLGGALYFYWMFANIVRCTFYGNSATVAGACIAFYATVIPVVGCILAYSLMSEAVHYESRDDITFSCCDIFGNAGGDWTTSIADQLGVNGNICEDPEFCGTDGSGENLLLQSDSPCLDCDGEPMGAYGQGCDESAAEPTNWSLLKALY